MVWHKNAEQNEYDGLEVSELSACSVSFSPDDRRVYSGHSYGSIKVWDARTGERTGVHDQHDKIVWSLSVSPDGGMMASTETNGDIRLWILPLENESNPSSVLSNYIDKVVSSGWLYKGKVLAIASSDGTVQLWHVAKKQLLHEWKGEGTYHSPLAVSPDGNYLAMASWKKVRLWRLPNDLDQLQRE